MDLFQLSLAVILFVSAFVITKMGVPVLVRAALTKRLFDDPHELRKIHSESVPTLGGIAFITALWLTFSLHPQSVEFQGIGYLLASSIVLFIVAVKDDLFVVAPSKKFMAQIAAAFFMIFGAGVYVQTFGGVFGFEALPYAASIVVTVAVYVVVINAINLIDGVDGLAASVVIISSLFFSFWFFSAGIYSLAMFSILLAAAMAGFLWHNREPASVFMGDTGALLSGFYLSFLGIEFLNSASAAPVIYDWQAGAPVVLVAALIVPLYDTLRVFIIRVLNGRSPFEADAEHIHHQLLHSGMTHTQVTLTIVGAQIFILGITIILVPVLSVNLLLLSVVVLSVLVFPTLSYKRLIFSKVMNKPFKEYTPYSEYTEEPKIDDLNEKEIRDELHKIEAGIEEEIASQKAS